MTFITVVFKIVLKQSEDRLCVFRKKRFTGSKCIMLCKDKILRNNTNKSRKY